MHREHHGYPSGDIDDCVEDRGQASLMVYVGWSVQSQHGELMWLEVRRQRSGTRALDVPQQRVDHRVADKMDPLRRNALTQQVFIGQPIGCKEHVRDSVRTAAI